MCCVKEKSCGFLFMYRVKDDTEASQLGGYDDDGGEKHDEDHGVFDEGDHGWCAQAAGVCVGGQDQEGDDQGQFDIDAHLRDGDGDTEHLQSDVRHGGYDTGDGDKQSECATAEAALHKVGGCYVAVLFAD